MNNSIQYIEFFYPYNPDVSSSIENTYINIIKERNPLLFTDNKNNSKMGFRFFEVDEEKNPFIYENRKNISHMYYYGIYLNDEEISYIHEILPYTSNNTRMIRCYCDCLVTDLTNEDITIEEYENSKKLIKR